MVDYLAAYQSFLQRGIVLFEELLALYASDAHTPKDWATITMAETSTQRDGLVQRLAIPKLTAAYTSTLISTIGHYLDSHWADYSEFPTANPAKRQQVERLHAALEALVNEIAPVHNALVASQLF